MNHNRILKPILNLFDNLAIGIANQFYAPRRNINHQQF